MPLNRYRKQLLEMSDKNKTVTARARHIDPRVTCICLLSSSFYFHFPGSWYSQQLEERDLCSHALGCSNEEAYSPVWVGVHSEASRQGLLSQIHDKGLADVKQPLGCRGKGRGGRGGCWEGSSAFLPPMVALTHPTLMVTTLPFFPWFSVNGWEWLWLFNFTPSCFSGNNI